MREEALAELTSHWDGEIESVRGLLRGRNWQEVEISKLNPHWPCAFLVGKAVLTCYLPADLIRALTDTEDVCEYALPGSAGSVCPTQATSMVSFGGVKLAAYVCGPGSCGK